MGRSDAALEAQALAYRERLVAEGVMPPEPQPAKATRHRRPDGYRSKLEAKFAQELQTCGVTIDGSRSGVWAYEPIKLRLADRTYYTPDFMVRGYFNEVWLIEVKGSWKAPHQKTSRVKLKIAAEQFHGWYRFAAATYDRTTGWKFEVIGKPGFQLEGGHGK